MPLDIARSFFFLVFFGIFFYFFVGFIIFFLIVFLTFSLIFLSLVWNFTYGLHRGVGGLDALGVVVHASTLPLLPLALPIAIGSVLACRATALLFY